MMVRSGLWAGTCLREVVREHDAAPRLGEWRDVVEHLGEVARALVRLADSSGAAEDVEHDEARLMLGRFGDEPFRLLLVAEVEPLGLVRHDEPAELAAVRVDAHATRERADAGPEWLDRLGLRVVSVTGMPTTLGAGTNEDAALIFRREEVSVFGSQPRISVMLAPGSATLTVRSQATQYISALWNRQPAAVAKITGTGMTPPAGI
jgi:hypothetical protein